MRSRVMLSVLLVLPAALAGATLSTVPAAAGATRCVSNAMGIPPAGAAYVGSTSTAQGSPAVHRVFYGWSSASTAARQAKADAAANRIPWFSFKVPHSWPSMATGAGDAWAKNIAVKLSRSGGPVWLAFSHEPEGDGGSIAQWVKMQKRLGPIVHRYSNNIAFTTISSAWTNFEGPAAYSMDKLWAGNGVVDIIGSDAYNGFGGVKNGKTNTKFSEMTRYYSKLGPWAAKHHVRWAIAESAYSNSAARKDAGWLNRAYSDLVKAGGIGYTYFDSSLHSKGSWSLGTVVKKQHFRQILATSARIC